MKIFSVNEMVEAERRADANGQSYARMMELAGAGVAHFVNQLIVQTGLQTGRVLILVGPGKNGGDGLVAGRYLAQQGHVVGFYLFKTRDPRADVNMGLVETMGLPVTYFEADEGLDRLAKETAQTDLIVDALLGTGVSRPIEGKLAQILERVRATLRLRAPAAANSERGFSPQFKRSDRESESNGNTWPQMAKIVAVDCPSGLNCDTGALDPLALPADLTVSFAGPKRGHYLFPGAVACGRLEVIDIGIDPQLLADLPLTLVTAAWVKHHLPERPLDGHKGRFGRLLIAAGSERYQGAPIFSAKAAFRAGSGLVSLAVPHRVRVGAATALPEATFPDLPAQSRFEREDADRLFELMREMTFQGIVVGPGLGEADRFLERLLAGPTLSEKSPLPPMVIDADGLNILARRSNWPDLLPADTVLTPHPGEMARLMGIDLPTLLSQNRIEVALTQARIWQVIVIYKGAYTVIGTPEGGGYLIPFANPLLGVGGSGDVLAGLIGSLIGQGMASAEAAAVGAYLHGAAGEIAKADFGQRGMLARELIDYIPRAFLSFEGGGRPPHPSPNF